jgi:hypothetical protein
LYASPVVLGLFSELEFELRAAGSWGSYSSRKTVAEDVIFTWTKPPAPRLHGRRHFMNPSQMKTNIKENETLKF